MRVTLFERFGGKCAYNAAGKEGFRRAGLVFARRLAEAIPGGAEIRYNPGGIAVSGDFTVHGDRVYVSFNADAICGLGILVRTCKGRGDYTGGPNMWFPLDALYQLDGEERLMAFVQDIHDEVEHDTA